MEDPGGGESDGGTEEDDGPLYDGHMVPQVVAGLSEEQQRVSDDRVVTRGLEISRIRNQPG